MSKRILILTVVVVGTIVSLIWWQARAPRRKGIETLKELNASLNAPDPADILKFISIPQALEGRATHEQATFARKALLEEISDEGVKALGKVAQFGPLLRLFPAEGPAWATQARVKPEDCVAFKAEREGIRTEVVLAKEQTGYRVVRCNNVRQLAPDQVLSQ